ncbi:MAG: DUF3631 domain-containing protein [Acidobacteria bacterium]|nr:DUF3631 domain-containing protein [Acidobacteriota bacterium]
MSNDLYAAQAAVEGAIQNDPVLLEKITRDHEYRNKPNVAAAALVEAEIIPALESFLTKYLILPEKAALPLACWTVATYLYKCFDSFPYLSIVSPAKRCGKTRLAEVLGCVALNPVLTTGISEAALFRLVDKGGCTLLLDEAEALKEKRNERSQAIVSILNAGYRQGASVYRCVPPKHELQPFSVYGPKAVIAIGSLPDTVFDRSIVIRMRRRKNGEPVGRFLSRKAKTESDPMRAALASMAVRRAADVSQVYSQLPEMDDLSDRNEEIWQSLFAVCAVLAPGRIAELRQAAVALSKGKAESDTDDSLPLKLLADIGELLAAFDEKVPSEELVSKLKALPVSPWNEPGRELTQNKLARMLKHFGPEPRGVRVGDKTPKGYLKAELEEAISLYVGSESATSATNQ